MKLAYTTAGNQSSPSLLLLHGFMGSGRDWQEIATELSHDCLCIMPDLPGHGESCLTYSDNDYTFTSTSASIVAVLDEIGLESVVVAGYSMGGRIALFTALEYPTRVRGLLLESASPGLVTDEARRHRVRDDEMRAGRLMEIGVERFVDEWYERPLFESLRRHDATLRTVKTRRRSNDARGLAMSLRFAGAGAQSPLWSRLQELRCPVRLVHGSLDTKFSSIASRMAGLIPGVSVVAVSDAGHAVHIEKTVAVSSIHRDFVQECWSHSEEKNRNV